MVFFVSNTLIPQVVHLTLNESDTRAKLIDPALHTRGWTEDLYSARRNRRRHCY